VALASVGVQTPAAVTVRLARLASDLRVPVAASVLADVLRQPDLPPETRVELEELRVSLADDPIPDDESEPPPIAEPEIDLAVGRDHRLQIMEAVPTAFDTEVLTVSVNGTARRMAMSQIEAIAVAGVKNAHGRQVLVGDLMLDAPWSDREALRVVRILSTAFDPRGLVESDDALEAFRILLADMIDSSGGAPLPDPDSARGRPFKSFGSLADYQREVLGVA